MPINDVLDIFMGSFTGLMTIMIVMLILVVIMTALRSSYAWKHESRRTRYSMDRINNEMHDDKKRMEEIKTMLSASSLYDGTKNEVLVKELKELQDRNSFHGVKINIKPRPEDDYRKPEKIIKGDKDDDSLVNVK